MRRRARETFVLGAERLADEAELDLRNEAEADHEPKYELDQTAPVEPAILVPEQAAGPPTGAGDSQEEPSGSARAPWRPRPPLAGLALGGAAVLVGLLLLLDGGDDGQRAAPPLSGARAPVASAPAIADAGGRRDLGGGGDRIEDRRSAHRPSGRSDAAPKPDRGSSRRELAPPTATNEGEHPDPPAPLADPAVTPASSAPAPAAPPATPAAEPVQSAASVRQEFGP